MQRLTSQIALNVDVACWLRKDTLAWTPCRSPAAGRQASDNKQHHLWATSSIIRIPSSEVQICMIRDDSCCCLESQAKPRLRLRAPRHRQHASLAPLPRRDAPNELLYDTACLTLSHCHASSLNCNTDNADLLDTFFGGTPAVIQC